MTALTLYLASFVVVFALGFQQMNVVASMYRMAFATSLVIGVSQLVQFKLLPQPTGWLDVAGYLLGNACGIVCAMKAHPALMRWRTKRATDRATRAAADAAPPASVRDRLRAAGDVFEPERAVTVERANLEADIAIDAAVHLLERFCNVVPLGRLAYFDTADTVCLGLDTPNVAHLTRALRYLELRDALLFHPQKRTLVRIKPC